MSPGVYGPGSLVDGRYRIERELGAGGMGALFIATQLGFGRRVAVKVLPPKMAHDKAARDRFVLEARAVCHLQHPNLVTYYDFGTDKGTGWMFLVMELLEGASLHEVLKTQGPLPASRVLHIIGLLCDALAEAHDGRVIHRDLKPANVMLVRRGNDPDFVKLIDFGIVRLLDPPTSGGRHKRITDAGMIVGTTGYLAPEYILHQVVNERVDIYALGIICYELIAGRRPFVHRDATQVLMMHVKTPPRPLTGLEDGRDWSGLTAINDVILGALTKDPNRRTRTVRAFKALLMAAAAPLLVDAHASQTTLQSGLDPDDQSTQQSTAIQFGTIGDSAPDDTGAARQEGGSQRTRARRGPLLWLALGAIAVAVVASAMAVGLALRSPQSPAPTTPGADVEEATSGSEDAPAPETTRAAELDSAEPSDRQPDDDRPMATPNPEARARARVQVRAPEPSTANPLQAFDRRGPDVAGARAERRGASESYPTPTQELPPDEPGASRRPQRAAVTVLARPHGKIFYRGRRVDRAGRAELNVPEGRQCFRAVFAVGADTRERRSCLAIKRGQRNFLRIDMPGGGP